MLLGNIYSFEIFVILNYNKAFYSNKISYLI